MTQRQHCMPFGAEIQADGRIRFCLWAPAAKQVTLYWRSESAEDEVAMDGNGGGWFSIVTAVAGNTVDYGFRIDGGLLLPDPASRMQAHDVHGLSRLIKPTAWNWQDTDWKGRPWEEAVIYELHIGTFSLSGNFRGVIEKLDHLVGLGITAIELMPIAAFPGIRNWGYDGVLLFAPVNCYGSPDDLKLLVQTAHNKGLMVFLDVVYNHLGPEGNSLHHYAPQFFSTRHHTPWGKAINFDGEDSAVIRRFFIDNALYWLEEYHLDGLRFDAVHGVLDDSARSIWEDIAQTVYNGPGANRHIHLMVENDNNAAHLLRCYSQSKTYTAQWNDDFHHALHIVLSGETHDYYSDYAQAPLQHLGRCLTSGFAYQGEPSAYRHGKTRGEPSDHLPLTAFINFLQNHDQIGNRAGGERLTALTSAAALRAATAILLLAPSPPLLFMGQEWGCEQPFCYFCDFTQDLNAKIRQGRCQECMQIPGRQAITTPPPDSIEAFELCRLNWQTLDVPEHQAWLALHRDLLNIRHSEIVRPLHGIAGGQACFRLSGTSVIQVEWLLGDHSRLALLANLGDELATTDFMPSGKTIYATHEILANNAQHDSGLPPWSVTWFLHTPPEAS